VLIIAFSIIYAISFSGRLRKIAHSMRIIQQGDCTHKVQLSGRDELTFLGQEVNELTERLQISEGKRHQFVSDASHELKTPLASIKLLSDSILQYDMDMDTVREFVTDIGNEAERLNRMTQKLLALTKGDAGSDYVEREIIYMVPTLKRVVKMLSGIAETNQITIYTEIKEDIPVLVQEDDLYQIIFNLVENGIKYNTPGGKLFISLQRKDDLAVLRVRDTGVGIPEDAIGHIFERFYRVDKARSRQTGGSGLGLAIVRSMVERNGGEIKLESKLGEGSVFTVEFPSFDTEEEVEQ
jgi:signal transduction histidine kinase